MKILPLILIIGLPSIAPVFAQSSYYRAQPANNQSNYQRSLYSQSNQNKPSIDKYVRPPGKSLTSEISIDIPAYPNAKFTNGSQFDGDAGKHMQIAYILNYKIAKEDPSRVLSWYANVLASSGLKIGQQTKNFIYASNDHALCDISCESVLSPPRSQLCNLRIHYTILSK